MKNKFDPIKALGEIPKSHAKKMRFLTTADRSVFSTIRYGLLFIMAWWSGTSRLGFNKLKEVLATHDPSGLLELVVVDTDGCPDLELCPELNYPLSGAAEVAWIRNGQVIRTSGMGYHPECFDPYTMELLANPPDA